MAEYIYTVTVASGNLYGGGTGNVFYLNGSRNSTGPGTVNWVNGGTLRFEQSDSSNNNHPLIFSTNTSTSGIISSGVTYYLDGASNQANYTNTTTFNAATTRYIEVTPSSETDFFYLCYVHGIGMGGIFDITQDTWGAKSWGTNTWGDQSSTAAAISGISLSSSIGTLEFAGSVNGWGRAEWGSGAWGITGSVLASGQSLSTSLGAITVDAKVEEGWGRGGWGNRAWGETFSVQLTGQQATVTAGTAIGKADVDVSVSGLDLLTITQGLNSIQIDNDVFVFASEDQIDTSVGTVAGQLSGDATAQPSGISGSISIGQVVPEPLVAVPVTGISTSLSLGSITLEQTTEEQVTGQSATISLGTVDPVAVYPVTTAGLLNGSAGSVTVTGGANISVSGIGLTANIGSVNVTSWSEIDPGVNNVWTTVDKAA